ncbi:DJ-1/PfpI family protein [Qipengyuania flava]|uniref:DJ-1/PfpI family protein n=1 Tax=Qipengyuania flava TaxID=192812 RepID=UPI00215AB4F4|nr:DJ-1/PfpI family protein [Qipengyuania flava]
MLFPNVTQLDLTGPVQVLNHLGDTRIELVASRMDAVPTDCGFSINPTTTYAECSGPDIICVPGGMGADDAMADEALLDWLRAAAEHAHWITSVCTGALVLGAAGLLLGRRATTHWLSRPLLAEFGAIPVEERVVFDGKLVTGGGVTAGIDFALELSARIRGEDHARRVQLALEYDPAPPFADGSPASADAQTVATVRAASEARQAERARKVREAAARLS